MGTSSSTAPQSEVLPLEYQSQRPVTRYRWVILALLFFGTTVNYVDRQVINILGNDLREQYNISKPEWGWIGAAFNYAYAAGQFISGGIIDKVGTRLGYPIALALWCGISMLTAFSIGVGQSMSGMMKAVFGVAMAAPALGFATMRALLGFAESPNFPAVTKTLAEWFPKKERAYAMGFVNAGTNIGILIALMIVAPISTRYGWQAAFIATGALGFIWLIFWVPMYRHPAEHKRVSPGELAIINSDPPEPTAKIPWRTLLAYKQTWAFAIAKFLTDATWMFYLIWFAPFLKDKHGLNLAALSLPLIVVYLMADVGSIYGGWLSSSLLKRGATVNRARKTAMLLSAIVVLPIMFASRVEGLWTCVFLLGLATAGHQGFSSNLYTLVSDSFPKRATAGVAGLGGCLGYIGAAQLSILTGYILKETNDNYTIPLIIAGSAYLVAFGVIHLLMPRWEPALMDDVKPVVV